MSDTLHIMQDNYEQLKALYGSHATRGNLSIVDNASLHRYVGVCETDYYGSLDAVLFVFAATAQEVVEQFETVVGAQADRAARIIDLATGKDIAFKTTYVLVDS